MGANVSVEPAALIGGEASDGLSQRLIARLGLPDGDPEVRDIVAMLGAALESAQQTRQAALLDDALSFAHGRLVVRGLTTASRRDLGEAVEAAVVTSLPAAERDGLHSLLMDSLAHPPTSWEAPLGSLSAAYLEHLLRGDRKAAVSLTRRCVTDGMGIDAILLDILEPAQRDVGRRWALGEISVAQEHFCTAVTQFVMTDLYPALFNGEESQRRLVAVHVPGSIHHVGLRMVVDILECRDWSTTYVVDDVTVESLPGIVAEDQADLVLVSASMPSQIALMTAMIRALREDPRTRDVKVVVGGRPFLVAPDLVDAVGADGWARDARSAVNVCDVLVGGSDAHS